MRRLSHFFFFSILACTIASAQSGCPNCLVDLPLLPEDTIFNTTLLNGIKGKTYQADLSFRLPETTTPVAAYDSTTPPNLPISKFVITGIDSLPAGLKWQANASEYDPNVNKDGCIRFCGTPADTGTIEMIVRLDVTVLVFTRPANFRVKLRIDPQTVTNDGFTMNNFTGCGSVEVDFINNHPSNGMDGFTYFWDFGDSTTYADENPPAHLYDTPGIYIVQYEAMADTVGYILSDVEFLEVECVDNLGLGAPDVFFIIKDAVGAEIFNSGADINNISLPYTFPVGLHLGLGDYTIEAWDEDSGLKGTDDLCGIASFTISDDTLTSGGFSINLTIENPIESVLSQDTVRVFYQPPVPTVTTTSDLEICEGTGEVFLFSSETTGNHWFKNGTAISGANDFSFQPMASGFYQVEVSTSRGCSAISDSTQVQIHDLPGALAFINEHNYLFISDSIQAANIAIQWIFNMDTLFGETGYDLCAEESGQYTVAFIDSNTGCTNTFSASVSIDPNFDCTVPNEEPQLTEFSIFPNPVSDFLNIHLSERMAQVGVISMWDALGRKLLSADMIEGKQDYVFPVGGVPSGSYILDIHTIEGSRIIKMIAVQR